ncbi:hypothetical protein K474DRAFT_1708864 [Panus rudis PR-1116 ss-1]|nr:hypothetical protein K474DRAFT_1708864 [Panus rudis PR-1116 ss-1]
MSFPDIPFSEPMETAIRHGAAVQAMTLVGLTVLLYDHILTLDLEARLLIICFINHIWRTSPCVVSTIFLFNRYIVPAMLIVDVYEFFGVGVDSAVFCRVWTAVQAYLTIASFMSIHTIVALRVNALHNGEKWISRFLLFAGVAYFCSSTAIITVAQVQLIPDLQPVHHACVGAIPSYLWTAWLPSVIFETILFCLTVYAMFGRNRRHSFNTLTLILYRDGMFYFVIVAFCSLFSLLVWAVADSTLLGLARYFALAIVNVAGSRMVLNLKSYAASKNQPLSSFWDIPYPSYSAPAALRTGNRDEEEQSHISTIDLELYSIEREFQHIGTRIH